MDNKELNKPAEKEKKKKSPWGFIKGLLLVFVGMILGTIGTVALLVIVAVGIFDINSKKLEIIANSSKFVDAETLEKIDDLAAYIDAFYYEDVDDEDLKNGLYYGIMSGVGDPYTCYYSPEEFKEMMTGLQGNYEGIGAYLRKDADKGYPYVYDFIEGGAAVECEELTAGDYIIEVDGEDVYGQNLDEVVSKVRGPEGTTVTLTMEGQKGKYEITLERRKIDTPTVKAEEKEDGIWYIQISEFDSITTGQFDNALRQAKEEGMKGLIIDLRGNPGGSLDTVVDICGEILPKGLIVYTEDKYGKREEYKSDGKNELDVPLAVLVDGGSASASEIMAGAIKDYGKGTLIGTKTYGKGIVQSMRGLQDGSAIKITTSKYYTPLGNNIHKIGIEPDIEIEFDSEKYLEDETDNQLDAAIDFIKDKLK